MPPHRLEEKCEMLRKAGHEFAAHVYLKSEFKKLMDRIEEADWSSLDFEVDLDNLDEDDSDEWS